MRLIHIVHPDDIKNLPPMYAYAVRPADISTLQDNAFFDMSRTGSEVILVVQYELGIKRIMSLASQISADKIWVHGSHKDRALPFDLIESLSRDYDVIATLSGDYVYGCARTYTELVDIYQTLLENLHVSVAFPVMFNDVWDVFMDRGDGFSRFSVIYKMIQDHVWDMKRKHYLMGLTNPAELTGYARGFTFAVRNSLAGVLSSRCYSDSRYGVRYTLGIGSLGVPVETELEAYQYSQQFTAFTANDELITQFIAGSGGELLWNSYKERLNEVSV